MPFPLHNETDMTFCLVAVLMAACGLLLLLYTVEHTILYIMGHYMVCARMPAHLWRGRADAATTTHPIVFGLDGLGVTNKATCLGQLAPFPNMAYLYKQRLQTISIVGLFSFPFSSTYSCLCLSLFPLSLSRTFTY